MRSSQVMISDTFVLSGTLKTVYLGFACTFLGLFWLDRKHIFPQFHCRFLLPRKVDRTKNLPKTDSVVT